MEALPVEALPVLLRAGPLAGGHDAGARCVGGLRVEAGDSRPPRRGRRIARRDESGGSIRHRSRGKRVRGGPPRRCWRSGTRAHGGGGAGGGLDVKMMKQGTRAAEEAHEAVGASSFLALDEQVAPSFAQVPPDVCDERVCP